MDNPRTFELPAHRTNIYVDVAHKDLMKKPLHNLHNFLEDKLSTGGSAIVYVRRKDVANSLSMQLNNLGMLSLPYYRGMAEYERIANQESWMQNEVRVVVATISFGLGIDKKDVRAVAHWGLPDDMESWFQEAGRGGRDGNPAWSRLYFSAEDRYWKERLIARDQELSTVDRERKQDNFQKITESVLNTKICRHAAYDDHLDSIEKRTSCNGMCDVCYDPQGVVERAEQLLQENSFPLVNQVAYDNADNGTSETDDCPMYQEVVEKFCSENEQVSESTSTEEDEPKRRLGKRQDDCEPVEEEEDIAAYFHTCGNCNETNVQNIITHLNNSNACLEAYARVILKEEVCEIKQQTLLDLSLLMGACIHPDCNNPHFGRKNLRYHVKDGCRNYYYYFTQTYLGAAWNDPVKLREKLFKKLRGLQPKNRSFKGSSNEPCTQKSLPLRNPEAERKRRWRDEIKRNISTDPILAMHFLNLEQADVLKIPCCLCRHQFSRAHTQQASSAIKPLNLDIWDEVDEHLRTALQGSRPEEHLLCDTTFWICSGCEKAHPPTTKFDGNLALFQSLQNEEMFTQKAVKIFDLNNESPVLVFAPSKFPSLDLDGSAAVLSSDFSLRKTFMMLPADISGADAFKEEFPSVLTRDWSTLTKFMVKQSILPGIYFLPNILFNYHRTQIQMAKVIREEQNKEMILAKSRKDEAGHRTLDQLDLTQNAQSNESIVGEPEEETDDSGEFKGALSSIAGTEDYFRKRVMEVQSKVETLGPVRTQYKIEVYSGKIDGKTGSSLLAPSLTKVIHEYNDCIIIWHIDPKT